MLEVSGGGFVLLIVLEYQWGGVLYIVDSPFSLNWILLWIKKAQGAGGFGGVWWSRPCTLRSHIPYRGRVSGRSTLLLCKGKLVLLLVGVARDTKDRRSISLGDGDGCATAGTVGSWHFIESLLLCRRWWLLWTRRRTWVGSWLSDLCGALIGTRAVT